MRLVGLGLAGALTLVAVPRVSRSEPFVSPRQLYKSVGNGVVLILATDGSEHGSGGAGSVITADGQVLTNAHVVAPAGRVRKRLFVFLRPTELRPDNLRRYRAELVDIDHRLDLALLKMRSPPDDLTVLPFADVSRVEIGEDVMAIGHPAMGTLWALMTGVVSARVEALDGVSGKDGFSSSATINSGSTGGPLLNRYGQILGINTCGWRRESPGFAITDFNFSLSSSVAVQWMKRSSTATGDKPEADNTQARKTESAQRCESHPREMTIPAAIVSSPAVGQRR